MGGLLLLFPVVPCDFVHFLSPQPQGQILTRSGVAEGHTSVRLGQPQPNYLKMLTSLQPGKTHCRQIKTNFISSLRRASHLKPENILRAHAWQEAAFLQGSRPRRRDPVVLSCPGQSGKQQRGSPKLLLSRLPIMASAICLVPVTAHCTE